MIVPPTQKVTQRFEPNHTSGVSFFFIPLVTRIWRSPPVRVNVRRHREASVRHGIALIA